MVATIEIPYALREQMLFMEVTWLYGDRDTDHQVFQVPLGARTVTVENVFAVMLSAALVTEDRRLVDAWTFSSECPTYGTTELPSGIFEVPTEYATIQEAIDAATSDAWDGPSGIVYVHPGVYNERVQLQQNVSLVGAGADQTILDGEGLGQDLIDFSGARNSLVRGFTLRNVGPRADGCSSEVDPAVCEAQRYAAAVNGNDSDYAYGGSCDTSVVLVHNIIEANDTGVALGYRAQAVIRNNLFLSNEGAVVAAFQDDHALIMGNTFYDNTEFAIGFTFGELDLVSNIIASGERGIYRSFYDDDPKLDLGCTVFYLVAIAFDSIAPIDAGDSLFVDLQLSDPAARDYRLVNGDWLQDLGCYDTLNLSFDAQPGAYGGIAGDWYQQEITIDELETMFAPAP